MRNQRAGVSPPINKLLLLTGDHSSLSSTSWTRSGWPFSISLSACSVRLIIFSAFSTNAFSSSALAMLRMGSQPIASAVSAFFNHREKSKYLFASRTEYHSCIKTPKTEIVTDCISIKFSDETSPFPVAAVPIQAAVEVVESKIATYNLVLNRTSFLNTPFTDTRPQECVLARYIVQR